MNEHDLLDAIGKTEETVLEASEKKPIPWKVLLTTAACLLLILSTAFSLFGPFLHSKPLPGQTISTEKITWLRNSNITSVSSGLNLMQSGEYAPNNQFAFQMSVEARVLDVLPDKYQNPFGHSNSQGYRILRMELLDPIFAHNMPSEFYYLLPEELSTDLKQFDSLVMTIVQQGCENVVMRNADCRRMEAFSFLFSSGYYDPHKGAMLAYNDGALDLTLWELDGWNESMDFLLNHDKYPGKINHTIEETKEFIREIVSQYQELNLFVCGDTVISNAILDWPEAQKIIEQVTPFENGYYCNTFNLQRSDYVVYTQFINGFETNEYISIDFVNKAIYTFNLFTEADLKNLPKIDRYIRSASRSTPPPQLVPVFEKDPYEFCGVNGSYEKHGDHVFGVVTIYWGYPDTQESDRNADCIIKKEKTQTYLLVYPNGEAVEARNYSIVQKLIAEYTG